MTEIIPEVSGTPDTTALPWPRRRLTREMGVIAATAIAVASVGWWAHDRSLKSAVQNESKNARMTAIHEATEIAREANQTALSLNTSIDMRRFDGSNAVIPALMLQGTIRFFGQNGEHDFVIENPLLPKRGLQALDSADPDSVWILAQSNTVDGSPFFYPLFVGRDLDRSIDIDPLQPVRNVNVAPCVQDIEPEGSITKVCVVDNQGRPTNLPAPGLVVRPQTE